MRIESDPYSQGLDRQVAVRLVCCTKAPDTKDRQKYERTPHFQAMRDELIARYSTCVLCGKPGTVPHHRRYGNALFQEDLHRDVILLCVRCHRRHHRK